MPKAFFAAHASSPILLALLLLLGATTTSTAQTPGSHPMTDIYGHMGIGTIAPDKSAILDLSTTTAGFLMPRMTTAERNTIASPATGLMIFNTNSKTIEFNIGTAFAPIWDTVVTTSSGGGLYWQLLGNSGTNPAINFIGTTDNQAFEIRVNNTGAVTGGNQRVMRYEPNATSPNIIGGFNGNSVTAGVVGATLAGGGSNGFLNTITDDYGVVGGGQNNRAGDNGGTTSDRGYATVGGGGANTASGYASTVGGGYFDTASGDGSTVGGGNINTASGVSSTVGGGYTNTASGSYSTVGGGFTNTASGFGSAVGGGDRNTASGGSSAIGGGQINTASRDYATVGGGFTNTASGYASTVGGGLRDTASGYASTVGGGERNTASADYATVGGGALNTASGDGSTVGGGYINTASEYASTVGGGYTNTASASYSTVGGGVYNTASGHYSTVGGGYTNTASASYSTVGGGYLNTAAGTYSAIPGGLGLTLDANADGSFGFHANNSGGTLPMTITEANVAVFGNTDLWLANNDNAPSELRFFEAYNTAGAFPNTANYTAFKAQTQANDITYTLPAANGAAGQVLTIAASPAPTATAATLEWASGGGGGWSLTGNAGTTAGTNFVGTTDNQAFEIHVDETGTATEGRRRVMRFEPNATSANIIGGFNGNSVTAGVVGATLAGGGSNGFLNTITDDYGVVGGGQNNRAGDNGGTTSDRGYATVGGGGINTASGYASTVGGGGVNTASGDYSTVGGGNDNTASGLYSTVGGGDDNTAAGDYSVIPGGRGLTLDATADRSFGFHANNLGGTRNMTISDANVAVFGNTDLWLANNDNAPSELRFFEAYNTAGAFPNTANYTAFKAQNQTADITYTLPAAAPASDDRILTSTATGTMSWGRKITKATVTKDIASVAAGAQGIETFTVTGAGVGGSVAVSPSANLTAGLVIGFARVSAANTVTVSFQNVSGAAIDEGSLDWEITVVE